MGPRAKRQLDKTSLELPQLESGVAILGSNPLFTGEEQALPQFTPLAMCN